MYIYAQTRQGRTVYVPSGGEHRTSNISIYSCKLNLLCVSARSEVGGMRDLS